MEFILEKGNITEQEAKVIVNSTRPDLKLNYGVISSHILAVGGVNLQKDCTVQYRNGIKYGEIAVTTGGDMNCDAVFHITLPAWLNEGDSVLEMTITNCLVKADMDGHESIVFPALGTGTLKYPIDAVVKIFFDAIIKFAKKKPVSLKKVILIATCCHGDLISAFENERVKNVYETSVEIISRLNQTFNSALERAIMCEDTSTHRSSDTKPTFWRRISKATDHRSDAVQQDAEMERPLLMEASVRKQPTPAVEQHPYVIFVVDDIVVQTADVLVNSTNNELYLNKGLISKTILAAAGPSIQQECKRSYPNGIKYWEMAQTDGGNLKHNKKIYHISLEHSPFSAVEHKYKELIQMLLNKADTAGFDSIAFPALGAGVIRYPSEKVASCMCQTALAFQGKHLKTVTFVVHPQDTDLWRAFRGQLGKPIHINYNVKPIGLRKYTSKSRKMSQPLNGVGDVDMPSINKAPYAHQELDCREPSSENLLESVTTLNSCNVNVLPSSDFCSSNDEPSCALGKRTLALSDNDEEYRPTEQSSTASEVHASNMHHKRAKHKRKRSNPVHIRCNILNETDQSMNEDDLMLAMMEKSQRNESYARHMKDMNRNRLVQLVLSNGFQLTQVASDGNCFYEAALAYMTGEIDCKYLRKQLCDHLKEHTNEYKDFLPVNNNVGGNLELYLLEVEKLRQDGYFSNRVTDLLPLALANWSGRSVRIFSSSALKPIIDVTPTHSQCSPTHSQCSPTHSQCSDKDRICLAYTSIPGFPDHYDTCIPLKTPIPRVVSSGTSTNERNIPNVDTLKSQSANVISGQMNLSPSQQTQTTTIQSPTTPRKSAESNTPPKKKLIRKRTPTPSNWKKNKRKLLRMSGSEYINANGKTMAAKSVQPIDCTKCRHRCSASIPDETRQTIFSSFWSLKSYKEQKDFVCSHTEEKKTRTYLDEDENIVQKKRKVHRTYSLDHNGQRYSVCKTFFRKTLDIGESYITHALQNKSHGAFGGSETRGKHTPHNKTCEEKLNVVRTHIKSFPRVDAHYTRKDTKRQFLGSELNIKKMFKLYSERCTSDGIEPVSTSLYRHIFNGEFNLSFHIPKRDQCALCQKYLRENANGSLLDELKDEYDKHQERKMKSREEKIKDKALAKKSTSISVATFDLEAVLSTPCSLVSELYYMRKLNCYNFTVYDVGIKTGTCFLWSEVDAQSGSCEIASCLQMYFKSLPPNISHVILYSDMCTGQNRNQYVAMSLLHAVTTMDHIITIDQKFLEPGHTQMECDAVHSSIEFAKKKTTIYVPSQWETVIRMARRKDPFLVVSVKYTDILDFKKLAHNKMRNTIIDTDGGRVNWCSMRWIRFLKSSPDRIFFKYEYEDATFKELNITVSSHGLSQNDTLMRKYISKQCISAAKKEDLLSLCRKGIIPPEYMEFYKNLPTDKQAADCLPVPDVTEEDADTDKE